MTPIHWFLWVMQAAVIVLRLCGVIAWPWWVVLAWLEVIGALLGLQFVCGLLVRIINWWEWRQMTPAQRARAELAESCRKMAQAIKVEGGAR